MGPAKFAWVDVEVGAAFGDLMRRQSVAIRARRVVVVLRAEVAVAVRVISVLCQFDGLSLTEHTCVRCLIFCRVNRLITQP